MYVCPQRLHVRTYPTVMQTTFGRCPGMLFTPSFPIPGGALVGELCYMGVCTRSSIVHLFNDHKMGFIYSTHSIMDQKL